MYNTQQMPSIIRRKNSLGIHSECLDSPVCTFGPFFFVLDDLEEKDLMKPICQSLPPKLVTNRLLLPGIEDELLHTVNIFKGVEEGVTDFVGVPIAAGITLSFFTQQNSWNENLGDLFWKITEVCSGLFFSIHTAHVVQCPFGAKLLDAVTCCCHKLQLWTISTML